MKLPFLSSATLLSAVVLLSSCGLLGGGDRITGSGPLVTDNRRLLEFDEIELNAPLDLIVMQGSEQMVDVSAQSQIQPVLTTEVKGGKLSINLPDNANMDGGSNIQITIADLKKLTINGSGNVVVRDFKGDKLQLSTDGSGSISITGVDYDNIDIKSGGSGDIDLSGSGNKVSINLTGSGDVDAYDFASKDVKVMSKGSGETRVAASSDLDVDLKGSGNIYYRGDPEVKMKDDGSGELTSEN